LFFIAIRAEIPPSKQKGMTMIRFAQLFAALLSLAGCHTTDLGRSVGWQEPPASNM
jgi:hypothetical protein